MIGEPCSPTDDGEAAERRGIIMNNPVILSHFFQVVPSDLLSSCRLVSKEWNLLSLKSWRSTATLTLSYQERPFWLPAEDPVEGQEQHDPEEFRLNQSIREYLNFVDDTATSHYDFAPHRQYILHKWSFQANWIPRFWNSIGTHVTSLEMRHCRFSGAREFRRITYQSCPNLRNLQLLYSTFMEVDPANLLEEPEYFEPAYGENTNLKKLTISLGGENHKRLPVSWLEFLAHFPALTSLEVSVFYMDGVAQHPDTENVLQAINKIHRHDRQKLPLTNVMICADRPVVSNDPNSFDVFTLFQRFGIPMQSLDIVLDPEVEGGIIKGIMEPHVKTLTKIGIQGSAGPIFPFGLQSQLFENIGELTLSGSLLDNLDFLQFMIHLEWLNILDESLDLDDRQYKDTRIVENTSKEILANTNVKYVRFLYRVIKTDLQFLTRLLPNVAVLDMVLNNELFPVVCENWSSLRGMSVYGDALTEEGIIGTGRTDQDLDGDGENEKEARPNITSLQNLISVGFMDVNVTSDIVVLGLLKLRKLGYFWPLRGTQIGDEQRNELTKNNINVLC